MNDTMENAYRGRSLFLTLFLYISIVLSPSGFLWILFKSNKAAHFLKNSSENEVLSFNIYTTLISAAISFFIIFSLIFIQKSNNLANNIFKSIESFNKYFFILLSLPFISLLLINGIETSRTMFTLFLILIFTTIFCLYFYLNLKFLFRIAERYNGYLGLFLIVSGFLFSLYKFSYWTILNVKALRIPSFDLALYHNLIWNTLDGSFLASTLVKGGTHMSAHFDPFLLLISLIYYFKQDVFTLLFLQTFFASFAAIPLYLISARVLDSRFAGALIGLAYLLHPALHGVVMYEFHSISLIIPFIFGLIFCLERGYWKTFFLLYVIALTVREDVPLILAGISVYAWDVCGKRKLAILSLLTGVIYLLLVKIFIMNDPGLFMSEGAVYDYSNKYSGMIPEGKGGEFRFLQTLMLNVEYVIAHAFESDKVKYLFLMTVPLLFMPIFAGRRLVLYLYPLVFTMLSSSPFVYSLHYQYNAFILPFLLILTSFGIKNMVESRFFHDFSGSSKSIKMTLALGVFISSLIMSFKFGALNENKSFKSPLWKPVHFESENTIKHKLGKYEDLEKLLPLIPERAKVQATRFLLPFVADRPWVNPFPHKDDISSYYLIRDSILSEHGKRRFQILKNDKDVSLVKQAGEIKLYKRNGPEINDN